jgi:hypothetical protein
MKPPYRLRSLAALAAILLPTGSLQAANVLFVDNETPHSSWQTLIESGGHNYTRFDTSTYSISLGNQASIDYVNSFDVIVMSGSNAAFNAVRAAGALWNAQPTPMINMGNYLISGQFQAASWRWTTPNNGTAPNASGVVDVLDADDPIWTGGTLIPGTPLTVDLHASNAGHLGLGTNTFLPNITTVAAQSSNNANIAIAYAAPEALRAGGAAQYFIASMTGGAVQAIPYTAEGEQVFLNAIAALTGGFPPEDQFQVRISQNGADFDFEWDSQPGKLYDLLASTDLATPIADWPVYDDGVTLHDEIPSAGGTTTRSAVPSADPRRFFAIREYDAPPPPPLLFADFEGDDDGGFTVVTPVGSAWVRGAPTSTDNGGTPNPGGSVTSGNSGSTNCWGTNLGNPGFYANPTTTRLRSPVIDMTGITAAELSFAQALNLPNTDSAVVNLISPTTDDIIAAGIHTSVDGVPNSAAWSVVNGISLSAGANQEFRIEWVLSGTGGDTQDYMGWYIDDVSVVEAGP